MTEQTPDAPCEWKEDEDGNFHSSCGQSFCFFVGGPVENKMKSCCYCGKALTEARWEFDDDDED